MDSTDLPLNSIRTDCGTQMRVSVNAQTVDDYVESMKRGCQFPPLTVFTDGRESWLVDGFHRFEAYRKRGVESVPCFVKEGNLDDAREFACCANQDHGLPRSATDKRNAVEAFFTIPGRDTLTNSEVARRIGVSTPFVKNVREELGVKASPASHFGAGSSKRQPLNDLIPSATEAGKLNRPKKPTGPVTTVNLDLPTNDKHEFAVTLLANLDPKYLKICTKYLDEIL